MDRVGAVAAGEFPIVRDFSLTMVDVGQMGRMVRFRGSSRIIGGMNVYHADGLMRRSGLDFVPLGDRDSPYREDGESVWLVLWLEGGFVYVAQGEGPGYLPRFRVPAGSYLRAWARAVSEVRTTAGAFLDLEAALDEPNLVERLILTGAQQARLLGRIPSLPRLIQLKVQQSDMAHLFGSVGLLTGLRWLELPRNGLLELPDGLTRLGRLEVLDASYNKISAFPDGLCGLTRLRYLNFSGNRLSAVPSCLSRVASLRDVRLGRNAFAGDIRDRIAREFADREGVRLVI